MARRANGRAPRAVLGSECGKVVSTFFPTSAPIHALNRVVALAPFRAYGTTTQERLVIGVDHRWKMGCGLRGEASLAACPFQDRIGLVSFGLCASARVNHRKVSPHQSRQLPDLDLISAAAKASVVKRPRFSSVIEQPCRRPCSLRASCLLERTKVVSVIGSRELRIGPLEAQMRAWMRPGSVTKVCVVKRKQRNRSLWTPRTPIGLRFAVGWFHVVHPAPPALGSAGSA